MGVYERKFYVSLSFTRNACEYRVKVYRWYRIETTLSVDCKIKKSL